MAEYRVEHDSMGEVRVPADRAVGRADATGRRELPDLGRAGRPARDPSARPRSRREAARGERGPARCRRGQSKVGDAIAAAADEVASGAHADAFPIDQFQTGSGTSTNMNMNEVLARLASEQLGDTGASE